MYCAGYLFLSWIQTIIAVLLLAESCLTTRKIPSLVPCPITEWNDAAYLNGKCYVIIDNQGQDWHWAKGYCESDKISGRLMEPRKLQEVEFLRATNFTRNKNVWVGVYGTDSNFRFVSDDSSVNFFDYFAPNNDSCSGQCCVHFAYDTTLFQDSKCASDSHIVPFSICETGIRQRFIISLPRLTPEGVCGNSEIRLELVAETTTHETRIGVIYRPDSESLETVYETVVISNTLVTNYQVSNLTFGDWKYIQSSSLEVISFQGITVTLVYQNDCTVRRTLLYPPFCDVMDSSNECPMYYRLVSSRLEEYDELSVVSMNAGDTQIKISFNCDDSLEDNYIDLDLVRFSNPSYMEVTLHQYQSANIRGNMYLDGIQIWASKEVAVYVNSYKEPFVISQAATTMKQMLPLHVASSEYASIRFSRLSQVGRVFVGWKRVTLYDKTTLTVYGGNFYASSSGTLTGTALDYWTSFLLTSNLPFQVYRVSSNFGRFEDYCWGPLLPKEMWKTEYTISTDWMRIMKTVHVLITVDKNLKAKFNNDTQSELRCETISNDWRQFSCLIEVKPDIHGPTFTLKLPAKFGAYLIWRSESEYRCQPLGIGTHVFNQVNFGREKLCRQREPIAEHPFSIKMEGVVTTVMQTSTPLSTTTSTTTECNTNPSTSTMSSSDTSETSAASATLTTLIPTTDGQTIPVNNTHCPVSTVKRTNLTVKEIENVVREIRNTLLVDAKKMSSFTRKKTSAKDERPSSTGIGFIGVALFILIFGFIILRDAITLFKWIGDAQFKH